MVRNLIIALCIVGLLILVGYRVVAKTNQEAQSKSAGQARKNAAAVVEVATSGPKAIAAIAQAVGTLESPYQVTLSPNIAGRVDYLQVREGDPVAAGEVLARIDPQYVEAQILQAQGNLDAAQQNLSKARITEMANTVAVNTTIGQDKAGVAGAIADYNETKITYEATVGAAHEAAVDAAAKVASSRSAVAAAQANLQLASANLEDASAKYARTYNLYIQGFDSAQDLDDQRAAEKVNQATVNAQQKNVDAANSALNSARAEYQAAADQEAIARKKGVSDLADAKAKWTQAQETLDAAVANRANIPAYAENIKALYSQVLAAKATLNQAVAQRAYLIVKSSIDGTVTRRLMDPGAEATVGSPLLIVQYLRWLFVTASLPVEDADQVHMGMDMAVSVDGIPGKTYQGKIIYVNKSADPTSRQFMIRCKLDNANRELRPGMYAKVQVIISYIPAPIAVPLEAVTTDSSNNSSVTTVDSNNVAHVVPVTLGVQDSNYVQILDGVTAGQRVIVLTYRPVADGAKVQIGTWAVKGKRGGAKGGSAARGPGSAGGGGTAGTTGNSGLPAPGAATGPSTPGTIGGRSSGVSPAGGNGTAAPGLASNGMAPPGPANSGATTTGVGTTGSTPTGSATTGSGATGSAGVGASGAAGAGK